MELKLFGSCCKLNRIVVDFSMAITNALNEFNGEDIKGYHSRTEICSIEVVTDLDSYISIHVCSYYFLKLRNNTNLMVFKVNHTLSYV